MSKWVFAITWIWEIIIGIVMIAYPGTLGIVAMVIGIIAIILGLVGIGMSWKMMKKMPPEKPAEKPAAK
jgi:heme O synthase-like polyprenyltransferase